MPDCGGLALVRRVATEELSFLSWTHGIRGYLSILGKPTIFADCVIRAREGARGEREVRMKGCAGAD